MTWVRNQPPEMQLSRNAAPRLCDPGPGQRRLGTESVSEAGVVDWPRGIPQGRPGADEATLPWGREEEGQLEDSLAHGFWGPLAEWAHVLGRALITVSWGGTGHVVQQGLGVEAPLCRACSPPHCQAALWGQVSLWNLLLFLVPRWGLCIFGVSCAVGEWAPLFSPLPWDTGGDQEPRGTARSSLGGSGSTEFQGCFFEIIDPKWHLLRGVWQAYSVPLGFWMKFSLVGPLERGCCKGEVGTLWSQSWSGLEATGELGDVGLVMCYSSGSRTLLEPWSGPEVSVQVAPSR